MIKITEYTYDIATFIFKPIIIPTRVQTLTSLLFFLSFNLVHRYSIIKKKLLRIYSIFNEK